MSVSRSRARNVRTAERLTSVDCKFLAVIFNFVCGKNILLVIIIKQQLIIFINIHCIAYIDTIDLSVYSTFNTTQPYLLLNLPFTKLYINTINIHYILILLNVIINLLFFSSNSQTPFYLC